MAIELTKMRKPNIWKNGRASHPYTVIAKFAKIIILCTGTLECMNFDTVSV